MGGEKREGKHHWRKTSTTVGSGGSRREYREFGDETEGRHELGRPRMVLILNWFWLNVKTFMSLLDTGLESGLL
jgi:hypothetical protein